MKGNVVMLDALRRLFGGASARHRVRRWHRLPMTQPARLTRRSGELRSVIVTQLSVGGARVTSATPLHRGEPVQLGLLLALKPHSIAAEVVYAVKERRSLQWHIGLRFTGVGAAGDETVAEFLADEQRRRETGFVIPRNARD